MPKIQIIQAETKVPSTTYPVQPVGLTAQAETGRHIQGLIDSIVSEQGRILEKQRAMNQTTEVAQAEIDVENENQKLIENLRRSPDPINYYRNWQAGFTKISKDRASKIIDPDTRKMAELNFQRMLYRNIVEQSHEGNILWLSTQRGERARIINEYIKNGESEKAIKLVENGINGGLYKPEEGQKLIIDIQDKADKKIKEDNYANALNMVMVDPTEDGLNRAIKLFDIPTEQQADLRKQQRIERDAKERQQKEIEDLARKKEDNEIADEYLNKNYSKVYQMAQRSKLLTAERRTFWGDHSEAAAKRKEEVEPGEEAAEIAYINEIRSKNVSPEVIKDYIITTPRLSETERRRQIEKSEKLKEKETNRGLRISNEYMKKEIISPKGIAGVISKSIPEDVRANNYANAQITLEDWVEKQMILEKPISGSDIQKKAEEIVNLYKSKISQRTPIIEKNMKDMIKGLGELGELSKGKAPEVVPKEEKVKQTKYKTIEEVRNAYNRKELTYAEAKEILERDFRLK